MNPHNVDNSNVPSDVLEAFDNTSPQQRINSDVPSDVLNAFDNAENKKKSGLGLYSGQRPSSFPLNGFLNQSELNSVPQSQLQNDDNGIRGTSQPVTNEVSIRPSEFALNKSGFNVGINQSIPQQTVKGNAQSILGITPIQDLEKQNTARPDNTLTVPNVGVFNRQVNVFGETTDKSITGNAPDQSVVLHNEYKTNRSAILNPTVVPPVGGLTPENNFGMGEMDISTTPIQDNLIAKNNVINDKNLLQNAPAPISKQQTFINTVHDNLQKLNEETITKAGAYASTVTDDPVAAGFITKAILGDEIAVSQKRQVDKGLDVPQSDLFKTGQAGIQALTAALDDKYKADPNNPDYVQQKMDLQNKSQNLMQQFPEYRREQLIKGIAEKLAQLHPEVKNNRAMANLYMPELKEAMGLTDADVKSLDFDNPIGTFLNLDYPTTNALTNLVAPIYKGALSLGASATRLAGSAVGADEDFLNSKLTQMEASPTYFNDIEGLQKSPIIVDTNKNSQTFLQDINNPDVGKTNYSFHTISNALANGVGNLVWFVYGAKGMGAIANKGLGALGSAIGTEGAEMATLLSKSPESVSEFSSLANKVIRNADGAITVNNIPFKLGAEATNEVGMAGLMIGQGYNSYYQKANVVVSNKPEDEWKRHTYALLNSSLDYLGFRVLGNVVKGLPPTAEKGIADILNDAPNMASVNRNALTSAVTKALTAAKAGAKESAFVGAATSASEIAKAAVTNVMGTTEASKEENKQLPDLILNSLEELPLSMFIPITGAKIISGVSQGKMYNENLYNSGLNPDTYRGQANKLFDLGTITQEQLNDRLQVINTTANVVNSIPSDIFQTLNHEQRVSYVKSKVREVALKAKAANIQDDALSGFYNKQIKDEVAKRADILNGGGKEGEFPENVSVIKPKTQEEIDNQIPTVTIAPKENTPETKKGVSVVLPQTIERGHEMPTVTVGGKTNENATEKTTEVPKPAEAASTTNEAANKVEQPTAEELVKRVEEKGVSGYKKTSIDEVGQQALQAPNSLKNQLGGDENLVTDLIAHHSEKQINDAIKEQQDGLGNNPTDQDITDVDNHIKLLEKGLEKRQLNAPTHTEVKEPLKDVESTTKALEEGIDNREIPKNELSILVNKFPEISDPQKNGFKESMGEGWKGATDAQRASLEKSYVNVSKEKAIAETYHKAKEDGSNPELVKAVEDLLKPKTELNTPTTTEVKSEKNDIKLQSKNDNNAELSKLLPDTLSPTEKQGSIAGGEANAEATSIVGAIQKANDAAKERGEGLSQERIKNQEAKQLKSQTPKSISEEQKVTTEDKENAAEKKIGKFESLAKEKADKIRNTELPSWLINKDPNIKRSGVDAESLKNTLADAIELVGKLMDKGVGFAEAVKRGGDKIIDHLLSEHPKGAKMKDEYEKSVREGFKNEARKNFENELKEAKKTESGEGGKEPPIKNKISEDEGDKMSGITHELTSETRKELNLPEYEKVTKTDEELNAEADKKIKEGYDAQSLIKKIEEGHQPTDVENTILKKYKAVLEAKVDKDPTDKNISELYKLVKASDAIGSEQGRALRSRKGLDLVDDSLGGYFVREMDALNVDKLTDEQKSDIQKEYDNIKKANDKLKKRVSDLEAKQSEQNAEKIIVKTKPSDIPKVRRTHEDFVKQRDALRDKLKQQIADYKAAGQKLGITADGGAESFVISAKMAKTIGEIVKSHVEEIGNKLSEVTKRTFDDVKDLFEGISEKDIHDVIAGVYNEKKLTRNETVAKLRDLRDEAKLVNKLDSILSGKEPKVSKEKVERNQQIKSLKDKIKSIRKQDKEDNKFYGEEILDDAKKLKTYNDNIDRRIKKLRDDLASGNILKEEPKKTILEDRELQKKYPGLYKQTLAAKDELIKLKTEREIRLLREQYANRSKKQKVKDVLTNVLNTPRTIMASVDYSAPLRQGIVASISHPVLASKSFIEMFKQSWSQKRFDRWHYDLEQSPEYKIMEDSGLYVADPHNPILTAKEEQFMNNLAEKIPFLGRAIKIPFTDKKVGGLIKGSERAYTAYLNKLRVDIFKNSISAFRDDGKTFENSPELYKGMASFINNATGRGNLGKLEGSAQTLNTLFFSPRLIAARLNMLNPVYYSKLPKEIRIKALLSMAKFLGVGLTVLALAKLNGIQTETDPRSTDFGKIKVKDTRWDIWGGFQQYIRFLGQMLSGQKKSTKTGKISEMGKKYGSATRFDNLISFARGKLAPVPAEAASILSGKNTIGQPLTLSGEAQNLLEPLLFQDIQDAYKTQGAKSVFTIGLPSVFGVGVQTQLPFEKQKHKN